MARWNVRGCYLDTVVRKCLLEEVTFKHRTEWNEGEDHRCTRGKSVPGIGLKMQRPWGRSVLRYCRNGKFLQCGRRAVCTGNSGRWLKEIPEARWSAGVFGEAQVVSWCLSCFLEETDDLLGRWSRAVVTVASSISCIWMFAKLRTLYHLGEFS